MTDPAVVPQPGDPHARPGHYPKENTVAGCELSTYTELAKVLADLPRLLQAERRRRRLSVRAAAQELNCSFSTVSRIESGEDCVLSNATAVLRWLDGAEPGPADRKVDDD